MLPEALNLTQVGELSKLSRLYLAVHHLPKPWFLYAKHKVIIPWPEVTMIFLDGTAQESEPLTVGGLNMCLLAPWHLLTMGRLWAQLFARTVPFNHITAWVSVFIISPFYKTRLRDISHKHMVTIRTSLSSHLCKSPRGPIGCRKNSGYGMGGSPFPALPLRFVYCSKDHLRGSNFLPGRLQAVHSQATRKYGLRDCECPLPIPRSSTARPVKEEA